MWIRGAPARHAKRGAKEARLCGVDRAAVGPMPGGQAPVGAAYNLPPFASRNNCNTLIPIK